jgi:hypothetical protein
MAVGQPETGGTGLRDLVFGNMHARRAELWPLKKGAALTYCELRRGVSLRQRAARWVRRVARAMWAVGPGCVERTTGPGGVSA